MFFPERIQGIRLEDRVLEVGPGGTPHSRSDVFLEYRLNSEQTALGQRGYAPPLKTTKLIIYYEGTRFPFADNEFDYVICSQVLEHVADVDQFVRELARVAPRGYLEFPVAFYDYLYDFPEHIQLLFCRDGIIHWFPKGESSLSEFKMATRFFYESLQKGYDGLIVQLTPFLFQGFEWQKEIRAQRVGTLRALFGEVSAYGLPEKRADAKMSAPPVGPLGSARALAHRVRHQVCRLVSIIGQTIFCSHHQREFRTRYLDFKRRSDALRLRFPLNWEDRRPCFGDDTGSTGFDRHYVYHAAWAARKLKEYAPRNHVDISSHLFFNAILSAFIPVEFYDYRPPRLQLPGLQVQSADLLQLPFGSGSIPSLSCLHVVEHIGLGRYGDSLDPEGDLKALTELKRVLAPGGHLLIAVPVGQPRICFNAHRIYAFRQIVEQLAPLQLREFALIPDDPRDGELITSASEALADRQTYGCGCFWFTKNEGV